MRLHLQTYAHADTESSALFLGAASRPRLESDTLELTTSFLELATSVGAADGAETPSPPPQDILRMFLLLVIEVWDVLKVVEDELAQKMQGEKISAFKAFGATASFF